MSQLSCYLIDLSQNGGYGYPKYQHELPKLVVHVADLQRRHTHGQTYIHTHTHIETHKYTHRMYSQAHNKAEPHDESACIFGSPYLGVGGPDFGSGGPDPKEAETLFQNNAFGRVAVRHSSKTVHLWDWRSKPNNVRRYSKTIETWR